LDFCCQLLTAVVRVFPAEKTEMLISPGIAGQREKKMIEKTRWDGLIQRLTGTQPLGESFDRIFSAYSEPHRHYHNFVHIEHCLEEFDAVKQLCESPDEVEFAIWLHDVSYDPHASDNEEMSALYARELLVELDCSESTACHVGDLILITRHDQPPLTQDAKIMVDIDISILGQPAHLFAVYEKSIRAEYSWVPEEGYRTGRAKILRSFLDKKSIYYTDRFEMLYGSQARTNLIKALVALEHAAGANEQQRLN
jgi:predicted metal-dependent HD superfamily phosphohydrolase